MAVYEAALNTGISANSLDALMGWTAGTSNAWADANNVPKFAVGTPNVPYDMLANIHKGEIITPATYSEGIRNGDLMMGDTGGIIKEMQNQNTLLNAIIAKQDRQIAILTETKEIANGSLGELQTLAEAV